MDRIKCTVSTNNSFVIRFKQTQETALKTRGKWKFPFHPQLILSRFLLFFCAAVKAILPGFSKGFEAVISHCLLCVCVCTVGDTLAMATKFRLLFGKDFENFGHVRDVQKRLKAYNCRLSSASWKRGFVRGCGKLCEVFGGVATPSSRPLSAMAGLTTQFPLISQKILVGSGKICDIHA